MPRTLSAPLIHQDCGKVGLRGERWSTYWKANTETSSHSLSHSYLWPKVASCRNVHVLGRNPTQTWGRCLNSAGHKIQTQNLLTVRRRCCPECMNTNLWSELQQEFFFPWRLSFKWFLFTDIWIRTFISESETKAASMRSASEQAFKTWWQ